MNTASARLAAIRPARVAVRSCAVLIIAAPFLSSMFSSVGRKVLPKLSPSCQTIYSDRTKRKSPLAPLSQRGELVHRPSTRFPHFDKEGSGEILQSRTTSLSLRPGSGQACTRWGGVGALLDGCLRTLGNLHPIAPSHPTFPSFACPRRLSRCSTGLYVC